MTARIRNIRNPISFALGVAFMLATGAAAAAPLGGEEIRALVSGKRVLLATPYGLEFPLHYRGDGRVDGDASGFTLARMFAPSETGRWWIDGDRLCQQWPTWYDGEALCFTVERTGERAISWVREDGMSGTARIED